MKKLYAICGLLVCGTVFIFIQIYFLRDVPVGTGFSMVSHTDMARRELKSDEDTAHENIASFLKICKLYNLKVFLIDSTVLLHIAEKKVANSSHHCKFLCHDQSVITFGAHGYHWIDHPIVLKNFQRHGFRIIKFVQSDPRISDLRQTHNISIPSHYILVRDGHVIHVVIFYQRRAKFSWYGALTIGAKERDAMMRCGIGYHGNYLKIGAHPGALDSIDIVKITLDGQELTAPRYPAQFLTQLSNSQFVECNYQRARQFYHDNPENLTQADINFRTKARKLLKLGKTLLDSLGIPFWLSSGTCLGWYRQCAIIPHSKDVDFGIFIKHYNSELIPTFTANNLALKHIFGKVSDSYELSFTFDDLKLDIFFFYEETDHMWNGGTQASTGRKFKYYFPKFTMCWTEFLELKVQVPCETESYVQANYGKDWWTPIKSWDWKDSPPNVRPNGEWSEAELDETVQLYQT